GTTTEIAATTFIQQGTLEVLNGTRSFQDDLTQRAGLATVAGAELTVGRTFQLAGGTLAGTGTVSGSLANTGGTVEPGGTTRLAHSRSPTTTPRPLGGRW